MNTNLGIRTEVGHIGEEGSVLKGSLEQKPRHWILLLAPMLISYVGDLASPL